MADGAEAKFGERLIGTLIDAHAANDPTRVWASIPVDNDDLSRGYQDISYRQFSNAINHAAWWLKDQLGTKGNRVETLAYAGPKDLRYPIIAVAALKLEKKILFCSPFGTVESQHHLLSSTKASVYLHARELGPLIRSVVGENFRISTLEVPEQPKWLFGDIAPYYPYIKTWEEAYADPWIIFHTSGTTGLPKPIIYTNWMMSTFDRAELMPHDYDETMCDQFRNKRFYVSMAMLHFVGMTAALQWTTFLNMVLVVAPPMNNTASQTIQVLQESKAEGAIMVPSQITDVFRTPLGLETLRRLGYLYFAGAPLSKAVAEKLVGYVKVQPAMGTTEAGAYWIEIRNEDDWDYYQFRAGNGMVMVPRTDTLCELIFKRQSQFARWQQIFHLHPHLDEFTTKDLWARHPTRPNLWRYSGRADDLVNLTHGESLYATPLETVIQEHPDIQTVIIGGEGRKRPFIMIEFGERASVSEKSKEAKLESVWPYIEQANEKCADVVKISREHVLFTNPAQRLPQTVKNTVLRTSAIALYESEIDRLYNS
ncbi:Non-canonical non-ribosomal peptide synthetase FUB8 [Lachnellula arida]|uniref:Non-canonical non-ribosomal peptide synthetase FUB8 n=1 Tax=Lachnellula arida TaxID=1316785 RepID=A0A8T9BT96_9HELO|nr:Non-canonical non-ribosomal peptide synthetase FUB8 [Lachnellula arida]